MLESMRLPVSLTFQLTRNCNLRCIYCSEPPGIRARTLDELKMMIDRLQGMKRIILSGGEPMASPHFWQILEYCQGKFERIVLSTNAVLITREAARRLKDLVHYIDITVDGPRAQHDDIRGNYTGVIKGITQVASEDIPLSIICVLLPRNRDTLQYICQTGDIFGAKKVKILTPIPKGNSVNLFEDFVTGDDLASVAEFLRQERQKNGWKPRITITDWMKVGKGHAILVEPDGRAVASPVWGNDDCIQPFANLMKDSGEELWNKFPFKENHLKKYLEETLIVLDDQKKFAA